MPNDDTQPLRQYCMTILGSAIYPTVDASDLVSAKVKLDAMRLRDIEQFDEHEVTIEVYDREKRDWVVAESLTAPAGHAPQLLTQEERDTLPAHPTADATRAFIAQYLAGNNRYQAARADLLAGIRELHDTYEAHKLLAHAINDLDPETQPGLAWVLGILEEASWHAFKRQSDLHTEVWERAFRAYDHAITAILPPRSETLPVYYPGMLPMPESANAKE